MKNLFLILFVVIATTTSIAQVAPNKYWVKFTDKNESPFSIENPSAFLSERALERRAAHGISIEENDLPVNPQYIQAVVETGVILHNVQKWFNSVTIITSDQNALNIINDFEFVVSVEKSSSIENIGNDKLEKPFFAHETYGTLPASHNQKSVTSGKSYDYGQAYNQIAMLNGIALHDMGFDGEGMIIAVLDAGFMNVDSYEAFDYLWDNGKILGTRDFVDPQNPNIFSSHTHGCSVLSTMGANLPGQIVGTAPQAAYWLLRSEDGDSEYLIEELNWVSAAEFADSLGADVINSSLGYNNFDDDSQDYSYEDMDGNTAPITIGADIAVSKGLIVVTSAGNEGSNSWQYITAPADGDSVFTIGSVDGSGFYSSFSSQGPTADGRLKPNVVAKGSSSTIVSGWSGEVTTGSGTSFSSPITAGMVTCLWQALPGKRNTEIMELIQQSAHLADDPTNLLGYGIPDYLGAYDLATDSGLELTVTNDIVIMPNPFKDQFIIVFSNAVKNVDRIEITDIAGKVMYRKDLGGLEAADYVIQGFETLSQGFYFVKVSSGDKTYTKKVIRKQN
jgi:hypothetical protein